MNRSSFIKRLLIAPFAGVLGIKGVEANRKKKLAVSIGQRATLSDEGKVTIAHWSDWDMDQEPTLSVWDGDKMRWKVKGVGG